MLRLRASLALMFVVLVALLAWGVLALPASQAQAFATNTPQVPSGFATSTPIGGAPVLRPLSTPAASRGSYALREWFAEQLGATLVKVAQSIDPNNPDDGLAFDLTQHELLQTFPNAYADSRLVQRLIDALSSEPRRLNSGNWQPVLRAYLEQALVLRPPSQQADGGLGGQYGPLNVLFLPANLDGGAPDAVLIIRALDATGALAYEGYALALMDAAGAFRLVTLPAQAAVLELVGDVTGDGVEEVMFSAEGDGINRRMFILTIIAGQAVDLVEPSDVLLYRDVLDWDTSTQPITLRVQAASRLPGAWACDALRPIEWRFISNLYRVNFPPNTDFEREDSLACRLAAADLFALPPNDAEAILADALNSFPADAADRDRALVTLALVYALDGELEEANAALDQALALNAAPTAWLTVQVEAIRAALASNTTGLAICAASSAASAAPACDINGLLRRSFGLLNLSNAAPLQSQLEAIGLPIRSVETVQTVGFAERQVVRFDLPEALAWAFRTNRDGTLSYEIYPEPEAALSASRPAQVDVPAGALQALLVQNDPLAALSALETALRLNSDAPPSDALRYMRALMLALVSNRPQARDAFYDLWSSAPGTVWADLAAAHLEQR